MRAVDLTKQEQDAVRAALQFLRVRLGGWLPAAKALHCAKKNLSMAGNGRRPVTPTIAFRVARLADVSIDDLLAGKYPPAGVCPHCGHGEAAQ